MFKRRTPITRWQKTKEALWPSMGWERAARYHMHRLKRLQGTPYFIASGFATGVAMSFTPFVGFHLMMAGITTWVLRGSMVSMIIGTVASGNPWTFPFIWVGTYKLGKVLLGQHGSRAASSTLSHVFTFSDLLKKPIDLLLPMSVGSIPFILISWPVSFYIVRYLVKKHKDARNKK